jgi:hypothetical protein
MLECGRLVGEGEGWPANLQKPQAPRWEESGVPKRSFRLDADRAVTAGCAVLREANGGRRTCCRPWVSASTAQLVVGVGLASRRKLRCPLLPHSRASALPGSGANALGTSAWTFRRRQKWDIRSEPF